MRLFLPAMLALAATSASANSLSLKPESLKPRAFIDVCAFINANLVVNIPLLGPTVVGVLDYCLCVSALPIFITTDLVAIAAVALVGESAVIAALTALINAATGHETCYYPDHAVQRCLPDDPCTFDCKDGFTPHPVPQQTECICEYPKTVCDGKCVSHCASQKVKRQANWVEPTCPRGWSACGVWSGNGLDYECVDVGKDLWSCGGCGIPLLPTDPAGVDCTAISGVHDVACVSGRCTVGRCKESFEVSSDRSACVPSTRARPHNPSFISSGAY